jgi:hypothetical protein
MLSSDEWNKLNITVGTLQIVRTALVNNSQGKSFDYTRGLNIII